MKYINLVSSWLYIINSIGARWVNIAHFSSQNLFIKTTFSSMVQVLGLWEIDENIKSCKTGYLKLADKISVASGVSQLEVRVI